MDVSQAPITVCYLIDRLCRGGTETQLLALIRHLDRAKVRPVLCLLDGFDPASMELTPADCAVLRLGVRSLHHPTTALAALRYFRFLRCHNVQVVHAYFKDSCLFGIPLARLARVPRVVVTQNNLGYWMTRFDRFTARIYQRAIDAMISNCEPCRQAVLRTFPTAERAVILENGINLDRFAQPVQRAGRRGGQRVGMVANLRPIKNPELFIQAARKLHVRFPDATFHLVGDGSLRPTLEALVRRVGLGDRIIFEGALADVPGFLASLDVAVLSSDSEGLSNAVLEYMASGKAIVATAVGGTPQLVRHGVTGLLVPPRNETALASAIGELLDDDDRRRQLGDAARQTVTRRFGMSMMADRFETFYEALLN